MQTKSSDVLTYLDEYAIVLNHQDLHTKCRFSLMPMKHPARRVNRFQYEGHSRYRPNPLSTAQRPTKCLSNLRRGSGILS